LRGIAILAVIFFHYAGGGGKNSDSALVRAISFVFGFGWAGVDLFFVLSGFLITGILLDTRNHPSYYQHFYARRILRIFPIFYLFAIILGLLTPVLKLHWSLGHLFFLIYLGYPAALVWPILTQISPMVLITHLWSLAVEEQFYMVWPWAIARLRTPSAVLRTCLAMGVSALLFRMLIVTTRWLDPHWASAFLISRMDPIALGAALAVLVRGPWRERVYRWAPLAFVITGSAVVVLCAARHSTDSGDPVMATAGYTAIALASGALLACALRPGLWLEWLLSWSVLRAFGTYSYGLYLYHFPLTVVLSPMKPHIIAYTHSLVIGSAVYVAVCLVINVVVAAASFHLFESPIMRLKSRFDYAQRSERRGEVLARVRK
jgi:peptidoglycan/LPS O-acetylase OafA/YrhL